MSQTLERILEAVKTLSEDERRELATALGGLNGSSPASAAEHQFETGLAEEGWLSLPQPYPPDRPPTALAPPLVAPGRPCSEILIEERR